VISRQQNPPQGGKGLRRMEETSRIGRAQEHPLPPKTPRPRPQKVLGKETKIETRMNKGNGNAGRKKKKGKRKGGTGGI